MMNRLKRIKRFITFIIIGSLILKGITALWLPLQFYYTPIEIQCPRGPNYVMRTGRIDIKISFAFYCFLSVPIPRSCFVSNNQNDRINYSAAITIENDRNHFYQLMSIKNHFERLYCVIEGKEYYRLTVPGLSKWLAHQFEVDLLEAVNQ